MKKLTLKNLNQEVLIGFESIIFSVIISIVLLRESINFILGL